MDTSVNERIKARRIQLGLEADRVAEALGISRATYYRYESKDIEKVPIAMLAPLSKILFTTPQYLMGWENATPDNLPDYISHKYRYVPGVCAAGIPVPTEACEQLPLLTVPDVVLGKHAGNKSLLFIHANGESMNKIFPDGSLLAVMPVELIDLKNGEIVVFEDENHGLSVKRYYRHDSTIIFKPDSTNDVYYDLTYRAEENKIRIIGKVVTYVVTL